MKSTIEKLEALIAAIKQAQRSLLTLTGLRDGPASDELRATAHDIGLNAPPGITLQQLANHVIDKLQAEHMRVRKQRRGTRAKQDPHGVKQARRPNVNGRKKK